MREELVCYVKNMATAAELDVKYFDNNPVPKRLFIFHRDSLITLKITLPDKDADVTVIEQFADNVRTVMEDQRHGRKPKPTDIINVSIAASSTAVWMYVLNQKIFNFAGFSAPTYS